VIVFDNIFESIAKQIFPFNQ